MTANVKERTLNQKIWLFSLPIIGELFVQQLYSLIDMTIIGRYLGAEPLAAVGNAANVVMLFLVGSGGFEMAVDVMVSRLLGQGKTKERLAMARDTIALSGLIGIGLVFIAWFSLSAIYQMMAVPSSMMTDALTYGRVYLLGLPIIYFYDVARAVLIANERAKTSFALLTASSALNLALNLLFIMGFKMGVAGSALATIVAQGIVMVVTLYLVYQLSEKEDAAFSIKPTLTFNRVKEILAIAIPTIFQQFAITFSSTLVQAWVNPFGKEVILGYVSVVKMMSVARIILIGFAQTLTLMAAQGLAAEDYPMVKKVYRFCTRYSLSYVVAFSIFSIPGMRMLSELFFDPSQNPGAYAFFKNYMYLFIGIQLVSIAKFLNEAMLRSMVLMKEYLYCNVGQLILQLILNYLMLRPVGSGSFSWADLIARSLCALWSSWMVVDEFRKLEGKSMQ